MRDLLEIVLDIAKGNHGNLQSHFFDSLGCLVPIPDFNGDGLLPQGFYSCDELSFRQAFVDNFPEMPKRDEIYEGFCRFRADITGHRISGTQWIDGSYVENNKEPSDVDILMIIRFDHANGLSKAAQKHLRERFKRGNDSKSLYSTDCYVIVWYPPGHPKRLVFEDQRDYWTTCFGNSKGTGCFSPLFGDCGPPKGIVEINIGKEDRCPPVHD